MSKRKNRTGRTPQTQKLRYSGAYGLHEDRRTKRLRARRDVDEHEIESGEDDSVADWRDRDVPDDH